MEQYFDIRLTDDQLRAISSVGLAHMGDAVFEILVRGLAVRPWQGHGKGLRSGHHPIGMRRKPVPEGPAHPAAFDAGGAWRFSSGGAMPRFTLCRPSQPCAVCRSHCTEALLGWLYLRGQKSADQ